MAEERRETVVVEGNDRQPRSYGWVVALVVVIVLLILFFVFGGFNMFGGGANNTKSVNVDTPDTVNVQPTQ